MDESDLTPRVVVTEDTVPRVETRRCAREGCPNLITAGAGAPMFCPDHDELNP